MKKIGYRLQVLGDREEIHSSPRGFTLLLAVLVSSILLALGIAIYNVASKQVILSSAGRESQFAFYAADAGVECALYWDYKSTPSAFLPSSPLTEISCGSGTLPLPGGGIAPLTRVSSNGGDTLTTSFSFSLGPSLSDSCVTVVVAKTIADPTTIIEAYGNNTCVTTNPRRIERAIRADY